MATEKKTTAKKAATKKATAKKVSWKISEGKQDGLPRKKILK